MIFKHCDYSRGFANSNKDVALKKKQNKLWVKTEREQQLKFEQLNTIIPHITSISKQSVHKSTYFKHNTISKACFSQRHINNSGKVKILFFLRTFSSQNLFTLFCVRNWITTSHKRKETLCNGVKATRTKKIWGGGAK